MRGAERGAGGETGISKLKKNRIKKKETTCLLSIRSLEEESVS